MQGVKTLTVSKIVNAKWLDAILNIYCYFTKTYGGSQISSYHNPWQAGKNISFRFLSINHKHLLRFERDTLLKPELQTLAPLNRLFPEDAPNHPPPASAGFLPLFKPPRARPCCIREGSLLQVGAGLRHSCSFDGGFEVMFMKVLMWFVGVKRK